MSDAPELPPRPLPRRGAVTVAGEWLQWFGVARLVTSAVSMLIVVGGAVWLLQAPAPATEATIPLAQGSSPAVTLPAVTSMVPSTAAVPEVSPLGSGSTPPAMLVVHVAGAVASPGVYELSPVTRVIDAVTVAGGPTADADLDGLNLAAPLADGERVYVPHAGEVDPAAVPSGGPAAPAESSDDAHRGPVNVNTATAAELETLPGVGPATAAAIVDERTRNGPFASIDDLERVPGIGPAKLAALRGQVTL
jgi:competence protein ComEA